MDSKLSATSTGDCCVSARAGHNTDPTKNTVKDCTSDERKKTTKKKSDKSLERASKRSRTSQGPSDGCCQTRRPSTPNIISPRTETEERKSTERKPEETEEPSKRSRTSQGPSKCCCQKRGLSLPNIANLKIETEERKSTERSRTSQGPSKCYCQKRGLSLPNIANLKIETEERKSTERKSEETEEPSKRSRTSQGPSKCCCQKGGPSLCNMKRSRKTSNLSKEPRDEATEASSSAKPGTSSSATNVPCKSKAIFDAKYKRGKRLGKGGYGLVFAGNRREDNLPVAIKHIPQQQTKRTTLLRDGGASNIPMEVSLMLKVNPAPGETSAAVALLDWYDLDNELILILERPDPCADLAHYVYSRRYALKEHHVKIIVKQLVSALIEIHSKGVFHRDIKLDNILLETGLDVPRVRIIDFGCGTYLKPGMYRTVQGTYVFTSPEWFLYRCYKAESTTVWQLGIAVFEMLHKRVPFWHSENIIYEHPKLKNSLSSDCKDFLLSCLAKRPQSRPTLERLKHHPFLM